MRITHKNLKQGIIKVLVENLDDLWYLSQIVEAGDRVEGKTVRKVKVTEEADATKRTLFLALVVESVDFSQSTSQLRIAGKVLEGTEDVAQGSYHTFAVESGTAIGIIKDSWPSYQLARLSDACDRKPSKVLVCAFDREQALFARVTPQGYEVLSRIKGDVARKDVDHKPGADFFEDIAKQLTDYDTRFGLVTLVLASPPFWRDGMLKVLSPELRKKAVIVSCSSADETGLNEVLSREETQKALQQESASVEAVVVEEVLTAIAKEGLVSYGFAEVESAVMAGAVKTLLVTDGLIQRLRREKAFTKLDTLMKNAEQMRADVMLVSSANPGGRKLDGLGGVAALLRYKLK